LPNKITTAALSWNEDGEPYSDQFQQRYFSRHDALAHSRYIFIEKNDLNQRWLDCQSASYVLAETGFGSGLNFLAVCQSFQQFVQAHPESPLKRLYFISFEKYPLAASDLSNAHQRWPQLTEFATQLQANYPSAIAGCHRLHIDINAGHQPTAVTEHQVIVDLWFGDIADTLPQVSYPPTGVVDSWLLDGFAPSKNPSMWSNAFFQNMAKITKDQASLATFSAEDSVKQGLAAAGFEVTKVKGFGKSREIITATFKREHSISSTQSWYHRPSPNNVETVTIIGGGIASAALCLSLAKRGVKVRLVCQDPALAQAASGNRQGGFYPLINSQHDYLSQLYSQAFFYSRQTFSQFDMVNKGDCGELCGVIQLAYNESLQQRYQAISDSGLFPRDLLQWLSPSQASDIAGVALSHRALYYPQGGWVAPAQLTQVMLAHASKLSEVEVIYNRQVSQISYQNEQWRLDFNSDEPLYAQCLVLANGHQLTNFAQTAQLPLYQTSGQISHVQSTKQLSPLKTLLCYQGYLTPAHQQQHCLGASFERNKTTAQLTANEQAQNLEKLVDCTAGSQWPLTIRLNKLAGKVGVRLSAKDHLPMVGAVPDFTATMAQYGDLARGKPASRYSPAPHYRNLYMIGALGSRGLCSASLLAEILACQLTGEPQPVNQALLDQLNPNRYWIKQLKRGKQLP